MIGDRVLELKKNVDEALTLLDARTVKHVVVSTGRDNNESGVDLGKDIHLEKAGYSIHTLPLLLVIHVYIRLNPTPPPYLFHLGIWGLCKLLLLHATSSALLPACCILFLWFLTLQSLLLQHFSENVSTLVSTVCRDMCIVLHTYKQDS